MGKTAVSGHTGKERIIEYDIIKGICILMVCLAHTGHGAYFMEYGFLYAFFFASGCTFRHKPFWSFLKSKILRIYVPFVLANMAGYLIGKFYYSLSGYPGYGYTLKEAVKKVLTFQIAENIMSPSWFLLPMFLVTFAFYFLQSIFMKVKYRDEIVLGISFLIYLAGLFLRHDINQIVWNRCAVVYNVSYALFFCALGYYYHNHENKIKAFLFGKYGIELIIISILFLTELHQHYEYSQNLRYGEISSAKLNVFVALISVYTIVYISRCVCRAPLFAKLFCLFGRRSMEIMLFHIASFGVVTFAFHWVMKWGYPMTWTFGYYSETLSYINALAGVIIPACAMEVYSIAKGYLMKLDIKRPKYRPIIQKEVYYEETE